MKEFTNKIELSLNNGDFATALEQYLAWFEALQNEHEEAVRSWHPTHRANAANLARQNFFQRVAEEAQVSERCQKAVSNFIGLHREPWQDRLQQPSFFYFPDLTAKPFYQAQEIVGLADTISHIQADLPLLLQFIGESEKSYIEHIGSAPNTQEWNALKQSWRATHFIDGHGLNRRLTSIPSCIKYLQQSLLPKCSPLAPEAFISNLEPGGYIPPHFGLSNIKLTVHVPLRVNPQAWLKAGQDTFTWQVSDSCMIFDDSYQHSAKNAGDTLRSVLIFDVWHPDLTEAEKGFIQHFIAEHNDWSNNVGRLAGLDKY
ncbi:aspartyl/asparaginyl beta-hydroxylase domain-containing protein [Alteromonas flava]|uniref:aspartyl/asparaginyl beta-hydroxylase domain-containing protein n=1 Tax=Alteromonas flava TaxID=2048003 RepID=UPI000C284287|nr:aspartyl/asparaginyl beta-hydroxylase domain-containing protein [Alteromonas flava]